MPEDKTSFEEKLLTSFNEQFATNQNHGQVIFIQFLSAILVVLIGYGYIYANTAQTADVWDVMRDPGSRKDIISYGLIHLFGTLLISELILILLATVVLNIGYSFRRDQLVIFKLRKKALGKDYQGIFGTMSFDPRGLSFWDFLPEFNRMFFYGIFILQVSLLFSFYIAFGRASCWEFFSWGSLAIYPLSFFTILWTIWLYSNYYKKYYWIMTDSKTKWWHVSIIKRSRKITGEITE